MTPEEFAAVLVFYAPFWGVIGLGLLVFLVVWLCLEAPRVFRYLLEDLREEWRRDL